MSSSSGVARDGNLNGCGSKQEDASSGRESEKQNNTPEEATNHSALEAQQRRRRRQEREQRQQELSREDTRLIAERRRAMVLASPEANSFDVSQVEPQHDHLHQAYRLTDKPEGLRSAKLADHKEDERPLIHIALPDKRRKWSQCSGASQVSTSFGCSLGSSSADESRRASSIGAGLDQDHRQREQARHLAAHQSSFIINCFQSARDSAKADLSRSSNDLFADSAGSLSGSLLGAHRTPAMNRSISQSMLELDESRIAPGAKFQVYWRNLAFGYTPTNVLARLGAKLRPNPPDAAASGRELVLKHISGSFQSNQLVAIIGPSGCGKTTLLQFLAGTNKHQRERLRIRGLSEPKVAYIGQDDSLLPGLTARETLMYASRLQNGRPDFDHAYHIEPILRQLGLSECAERNVSKLSGGQAKRVTIAQQLLYPTNLLILDEVTSGLDASTSYSIVRLLKYLVSDHRYPMSIVMSIHQPSARLFAVFDHLYVMSGGSCLYEGSCDLGEINERLAKFGPACPPYHNMADYLIELACAPDSEVAAELSSSLNCSKPADGLAAGLSGRDWLADDSEPARTRASMIEHQHKLHQAQWVGEQQQPRQPRQREQAGGQLDQSLHSAVELARRHRPRPLMYHFQTHLWRSLLRIRRSYILTYLQLATYIVLGLQLATFYGPDIGQLGGCPRLPASLMSYVMSSGSDLREQENDSMALEGRRIQENMNFLLIAVMLATFAALEITVITFPMEAKTIKREWSNGWYSVSSYFAGRTLADLPFQLAFVMLFCLLVYQLTGQFGLATWRFGSFVSIVMMTALVAQSFGFMFGAIFMNNLPAAVFTAPLAIFPSLLFSGFFSRVSQVPAFYKPMTYVSHFRYAFDGLLVTLYGHDRCQCDQEALDQYHRGLHNQTSSMRDMFSSLFGAADCAPSSSAGLEEPAATSTTASGIISHDDLGAIQASNSTLAAQLLKTIVANAPDARATSRAVASQSAALPSGFMKPIEDALVDSLLERMNSTSGEQAPAGTTPMPGDETPAAGESILDRLADQFAQKLTRLLNRQANFGKEMPRSCRQLNSFLMSEFELQDEDLLFSLLMLIMMVLLTRIVCKYLLSYTIASRNR